MSSTAEQMRAWRGPALLTYGFRPFFFGAGLWAAVAMALWVPMLNGVFLLPTAFDPISWHAHEFLFGYLGAAVAGFLLTAVPNWTGRLPIVGWPLGGFFALWILGRIAVAVSAGLSPALVAVADLLFLVVLAAAVAREIVKGRNWRILLKNSVGDRRTTKAENIVLAGCSSALLSWNNPSKRRTMFCGVG